MIGEKGVISCGVYGLEPKLYRKGKETLKFKTESKLLDHDHHMEWINGIKGGYGSAAYEKITAPFEYAGPFTETVLMGNLAIRSYMSMGKEKPKYYPDRYHTSEYGKFVGRKQHAPQDYPQSCAIIQILCGRRRSGYYRLPIWLFEVIPNSGRTQVNLTTN